MKRLLLPLGLLVGSTWLLGWLGLAFNALTLLLLLVLGLACGLLLQHSRKLQRQTTLLLKALANQDVSFRLPQQPELQSLWQQVQQQLMHSRQQAEARAQYLNALLTQLEVAVLEFDQHNRLLQANPAAERLLGSQLLEQTRQGLCEDSPGALPLLWQKLQQPEALQKGELLWQSEGGQDRLAFSLVQSQLLGQPRKLLTLQSIQQQLLAQEVRAYQQLTRILTHEIANSINPMVSLAQSSLTLLPVAGSVLDAESHADLQLATTTIARRGEHLSQFIAAFKTLSTPVQAELAAVSLADSLARVQRLLQQELAGIELCTLMPTELPPLWLDPALLEQVLINLLKNAAEALQATSQPRIECQAHYQHPHWLLDIADNGPGITASAAEQLFVPFFTTKASGSGIGLSLARALMQAQGGELRYLPRSEGACFRLRLN
ncbi:ATP-binding protein [Alkalimonas sp.]|uniref:sensor histidine kinase n=1 Tax=Alkalimonas sp. TaxID=1872453 RepID=UPI00263B594A|nr:ATP-binding protein [Alkalimonas sp.]MCC5827612.1 PAS domain-containing protein [Alkalimonas sp.]